MSKINLNQLGSSGQSTLGIASGRSGSATPGGGGRGSIGFNIGPNGSSSVNFNFIVRKKLTENQINSPLKELYTPNGGKVKSPLVFPQDLDNHHYMIYNVMNKRRLSRDIKGSENVTKSIVLPIPNNLQVGYGANYTNENLGIFGAGAANQLDAGVGDIAQQVTNKISEISSRIGNGDTDAAIQAASITAPIALASGLTARLGPLAGLLTLGGTGGGVISGISADLGLSLNPHLAVIFDSVGFRSFTFTYKLIARNQTESDTIKRIINTFRYYMHPSYAGGNLAFEYPNEFRIEFSESLSPNLFKIENSVLTSFNVNYNGEGFPVFFEDTHAPVSIDISLNFQETRILTKEIFTQDGERGDESSVGGDPF